MRSYIAVECHMKSKWHGIFYFLFSAHSYTYTLQIYVSYFTLTWSVFNFSLFTFFSVHCVPGTLCVRCAQKSDWLYVPEKIKKWRDCLSCPKTTDWSTSKQGIAFSWLFQSVVLAHVKQSLHFDFPQFLGLTGDCDIGYRYGEYPIDNTLWYLPVTCTRRVCKTSVFIYSLHST